MTDNLARARAWIDHAVARERSHTMGLETVADMALRQPGVSELLECCAAALAAAVRAKGEADATDAGTWMRSGTAQHLRDHAADVPPPPDRR